VVTVGFAVELSGSFASCRLSQHRTIVGNGVFFDKVPAIDSIWDAVHTFIRIRAGVLLAAGAIGAQDSAAWALAAGLLGGTITAGTHFLKASGRATINTSPEPLTNWTASFSEDAFLLADLWLAFKHPLVFLAALLLFLAFATWALPKLWRLSKVASTSYFARKAQAYTRLRKVNA